MSELIIRPAETDNDTIALHGFLCIVAGPLLPGDIDANDSIQEIWRVVNQECALMAINGEGLLVGTIGLVKAKFWWGKTEFLANRWFFALPDLGAGKLLLVEAEAMAKDVGLELHIFDETKGRLKIFNRNPRRMAENPFLVKAATTGPEISNRLH
jgi:hypothetical protein